MQPVLKNAGDALRAAQGQRVVNPASFSDLSDLAIDRMGKKARELTPEERTKLSKAASDKQRADTEAVSAADRVRTEVRKQARGKRMTFDQLKEELAADLKTKLEDCVI